VRNVVDRQWQQPVNRVQQTRPDSPKRLDVARAGKHELRRGEGGLGLESGNSTFVAANFSSEATSSG